MAFQCFDYSESYINTYNVYRKKADEVAKSKSILDLYLPSTLKKILNQSQDHRNFNVLSVGSGDGEIDRHVIKTVREVLLAQEKYQNTKMFNRALEPNPYYVSQYQAKLNEESLTNASDNQTTYEVLQQSWQEYDVQSRSKRNLIQFDLVHFVHSLLYAAGDNLEETLVHCFDNELKENGQILSISSELIKGKVMPKLWGDGKHAGEYLPERIMRIADKRGWNVERHKYEYCIDVTEVFDEKSSEGNLLLDFMTQTKDFRGTRKDKIKECLEIIRDLTNVRDGKYLINKFDDVLIICL